jgi:hypothetical protein
MQKYISLSTVELTMSKLILEAELKVSKKTHKKKTMEGEKEYNYGSLSLDNPMLLPYVGKIVKVKVESKK